MAISNRDISAALADYLERYPEEAALLSEPVRLLSQGGDFASRRNFPVHVTAGALLVRGTEILLVEHHAYGSSCSLAATWSRTMSPYPARQSASCSQTAAAAWRSQPGS